MDLTARSFSQPSEAWTRCKPEKLMKIITVQGSAATPGSNLAHLVQLANPVSAPSVSDRHAASHECECTKGPPQYVSRECEDVSIPHEAFSSWKEVPASYPEHGQVLRESHINVESYVAQGGDHHERLAQNTADIVAVQRKA